MRSNLTSEHSHSLFHDSIQILPTESHHKVDKTQSDGYTIFENLRLVTQNVDTTFY